MPTYLNSTSAPIIVGLSRIEAGQSVKTGEYLLSLPAGITQTSANPYFDPTIYSTVLTSTTTVTVPTTFLDTSTGKQVGLVGNYKIKVYVGTGSCTVKVNDAAAVPRFVGQYETWDITCMSRIINSVIITITSGTIYISIDKA